MCRRVAPAFAPGHIARGAYRRNDDRCLLLALGVSDLARGALGESLVHHRAATGAQIRTMLDHARRDLRDVGDFRRAQAEGIAGAHLLRFGREGVARAGRDDRDDRDDGGKAEGEAGVADLARQGLGRMALGRRGVGGNGQSTPATFYSSLRFIQL